MAILTQDLTVNNTSANRAIVLSSVIFTDGTKFYLGQGLTLPYSIPALGSVLVPVSFSTNNTTGTINDTVTIKSDADEFILTVPLTATEGVAPTVADPIVDLAGTTENGQTTLTWTAPLNGGSAIGGYNVYYGPSGGALVLFEYINALTSLVTGLTNDTAYDFDVRAVNSIGESLASNLVTITPTIPLWTELTRSSAFSNGFSADGASGVTVSRTAIDVDSLDLTWDITTATSVASPILSSTTDSSEAFSAGMQVKISCDFLNVTQEFKINDMRASNLTSEIPIVDTVIPIGDTLGFEHVIDVVNSGTSWGAVTIRWDSSLYNNTNGTAEVRNFKIFYKQ